MATSSSGSGFLLHRGAAASPPSGTAVRGVPSLWDCAGSYPARWRGDPGRGRLAASVLAPTRSYRCTGQHHPYPLGQVYANRRASRPQRHGRAGTGSRAAGLCPARSLCYGRAVGGQSTLRLSRPGALVRGVRAGCALTARRSSAQCSAARRPHRGRSRPSSSWTLRTDLEWSWASVSGPSPGWLNHRLWQTIAARRRGGAGRGDPGPGSGAALTRVARSRSLTTILVGQLARTARVRARGRCSTVFGRLAHFNVHRNSQCSCSRPVKNRRPTDEVGCFDWASTADLAARPERSFSVPATASRCRSLLTVTLEGPASGRSEVAGAGRSLRSGDPPAPASGFDGSRVGMCSRAAAPGRGSISAGRTCTRTVSGGGVRLTGSPSVALAVRRAGDSSAHLTCLTAW